MGVSYKSRMVLWTRACGRCQFAGCNKELLGDLISGRQTLNKAYVAHIVAETPGGPRGDPVRSDLLADDVSNLLLLCDEHHRLIDGQETRAEYTVQRLSEMKARHESRIRAASAVTDESGSHVLFYGARIGEHDTPLQFDHAAKALQPTRWAAEPRPIALELRSLTFADHEALYWSAQIENLRRIYRARVESRIAQGDISSISVFALAPQPLLMELGRLIGDITSAVVYQLHREPPGWDWRSAGSPISLTINEPAGRGERVALKLGLSATITDRRIRDVLGDADIWSLTSEKPHNDIIQSEEDLKIFRTAVRSVLDRIKAKHGEGAKIHVFPALPVSAAVEVGRAWMPKADLPLVIYDQCRMAGGFVARHTLSQISQVENQLMEVADA